jgi:hypothetical protein
MFERSQFEPEIRRAWWDMTSSRMRGQTCSVDHNPTTVHISHFLCVLYLSFCALYSLFDRSIASQMRVRFIQRGTLTGVVHRDRSMSSVSSHQSRIRLSYHFIITFNARPIESKTKSCNPINFCEDIIVNSHGIYPLVEGKTSRQREISIEGRCFWVDYSNVFVADSTIQLYPVTSFVYIFFLTDLIAQSQETRSDLENISDQKVRSCWTAYSGHTHTHPQSEECNLIRKRRIMGFRTGTW